MDCGRWDLDSLLSHMLETDVDVKLVQKKSEDVMEDVMELVEYLQANTLYAVANVRRG